MLEPAGTHLDDVVHLIQLSLTPVFLLTAVASLLSVFTTRLARVADQVKSLAEKADASDARHDPSDVRRLVFLKRRSLLLDGAVILGAISGGCTCCAVLTLFLGLLRSVATQGILLTFFGLGILCTIGALAAFLVEVLLASRGIRETVDANVRLADF